MRNNRTVRLNSLLREVISEVIQRDLRNPKIAKFVSVTAVDITKDLKYAKVYISIIGTDDEKKDTIQALNQAKGYISVLASKKVVMRYFPTLKFELDDSVEKHMKIERILKDINKK